MKKILLTLVTAMLVLPAAHADSIALLLSSSLQSAAPGDTISYVATVSAAASNTGTIYLNGDSFNVSGAAYLDDSSYLSSFPLSLNPGDSYTGVLFTLALPNGAITNYSGSFSLLGGPDSYSYNTLATQAFTAAATPEPSSWILVLTSALMVTAGTRRVRTQFIK